MLVYCAHESPRVKYVLDEILVRRLGIKYKTTDNADYFEKTSSNRINYSNTIFTNCINIPASNLLYEEDIRIFEPEIKQDENWFYMMFPFNWEIPHDLPQPTQLLPFDLFLFNFCLFDLKDHDHSKLQVLINQKYLPCFLYFFVLTAL